MIYDISHKTLYRYSQPVVQSHHLVRMSPRAVEMQTVYHHSIHVEPVPAVRHDGLDTFGNPIVILDIEKPHQELVLHARSRIKVEPRAEVRLQDTAPWDRLDDHIYRSQTGVCLDVVQFRCASRLTPASLALYDYAKGSFRRDRPVLEAAMQLVRRIYKDFTFDASATDVSTPVSQVFQQRRGVCQDFVHLALACLRAVGVPARYVSGYMLTQPPPGQPRLQGADASHAWFAVWAPGVGWVDFDPTNGILVDDKHIAIAFGRDYDDVSPISGVLLGGGAHTVSVGVDVIPSF